MFGGIEIWLYGVIVGVGKCPKLTMANSIKFIEERE